MIGCCLAAQLFVISRVSCPPRTLRALQSLRVGCSPCFWPFLDYPMFSDPHYEGETVLRSFVVLTHEDGCEQHLLPERDAGAFDTQAILAAHGRGDDAEVRRLVRVGLGTNAIADAPVRVRVEQVLLALTGEGFVPVRQGVLRTGASPGIESASGPARGPIAEDREREVGCGCPLETPRVPLVRSSEGLAGGAAGVPRGVPLGGPQR